MFRSKQHFPASTTDSSGNHCVAALVFSGALALCLSGKNYEQRVSSVTRFATAAEFMKRVKRIEGNRAVFDVTIAKPLGIVPQAFPTRPGVGIAKIKEGGNADLLNNKVILEGGEGMWILEGDEVVAVNGKMCEGQGLDVMNALVKEAEGDAITLTLVRNVQAGPVKVVWMPTKKMATMKRGTSLRVCEEWLGARVRFSCENGWCSSCWHVDDHYDAVYRICKNVVPYTWDNVLPLILIAKDEAKRRKGLDVKYLLQADGLLPPRQD